ASKQASKQASKYYKNFCYFKMINIFLLLGTNQNSILSLLFYPLFLMNFSILILDIKEKY
ncbi:hypothetical protein, partial [Gallibacterium anatis]